MTAQTGHKNQSSDPASLLEHFGLTRQEASVYCTLLEHGDLNGYEVAKHTGISRSNTYTALACLVDKGAAWLVEGSPTRYSSVPADEFCSNRLNHLQNLRTQLAACLPTRREQQGTYATIKGKDHILDRIRNLLEDTRERVYLALEGSLLEQFKPQLETILDRGLKVVIITDTETARNIGTSTEKTGAKLWHTARVYGGILEANQVRIIVDSRFVLTGSIAGGPAASCLHSDQQNLVDLFKSSLKNEIRLIELGCGTTTED